MSKKAKQYKCCETTPAHAKNKNLRKDCIFHLKEIQPKF